jgi:hypothetical protein
LQQLFQYVYLWYQLHVWQNEVKRMKKLVLLFGWSMTAMGAPLADPLFPLRSLPPRSVEWAHGSQDEVDRRALGAFAKSEQLDRDDPVTIKLQEWADGAYQSLNARYPSITGRLPRPEVIVVKDQQVNAFVSKSLVCRSVAVEFAAAPSDAEPLPPETLIMINSNGGAGLFERRQLDCLDLRSEGADPRELLGYYQESLAVKGCELTATDSKLIVGPSCKLPLTVNTKGAAGVAHYAVLPRVIVTTGLIELLKSDDELAYALMHELVHYFRAHGVLSKSSYQFFYRDNEENRRRLIPRPASELQQLGAELLKLPGYRTQPVSGQRYHSELFSYLRTMITNLVEPWPKDACEPLVALKNDPVFWTLMGRFPQQPLAGEGLAAYFLYEERVQSCLAALPLIRKAQDKEEGVTFAQAKSLLWFADWNTLERREDPLVLLDAWQSMNQRMLDREEQKNRLLQQALDERVGYYTTEEEADQLALALMVMIGKPPEAASHHWWKMAESKQGFEQDGPYNFGFTRCRDLFNATPRWSSGGRAVTIPVGSFAEPHHSSCYRLYAISERLRLIPWEFFLNWGT